MHSSIFLPLSAAVLLLSAPFQSADPACNLPVPILCRQSGMPSVAMPGRASPFHPPQAVGAGDSSGFRRKVETMEPTGTKHFFVFSADRATRRGLLIFLCIASAGADVQGLTHCRTQKDACESGHTVHGCTQHIFLPCSHNGKLQQPVR